MNNSVRGLYQSEQLLLDALLQSISELWTVHFEHLLVSVELEETIERVLHEHNRLVLELLIIRYRTTRHGVIFRDNFE